MAPLQSLHAVGATVTAQRKRRGRKPETIIVHISRWSRWLADPQETRELRHLLRELRAALKGAKT